LIQELKYAKPLSNSAFNYNLRRYTMARLTHANDSIAVLGRGDHRFPLSDQLEASHL
jgi:hypothetical protein